MAQVASPYGLRPVQVLGGTPFAGSIRSYPLIADAARGLFFGDPVGLVGGQLTAVVASPTGTLSANSPIGVFMGAEWQDPIRGFVNSQFVPAGLIAGGATKVFCKILDHPKCVFRIQANASIALTAIGMNIPIIGFANGVVATGNSQVAANGPAAAAGALRIIGFFNAPGSAPGDPFTDLLVIWAPGVHRHENNTGQ